MTDLSLTPAQMLDAVILDVTRECMALRLKGRRPQQVRVSPILWDFLSLAGTADQLTQGPELRESLCGLPVVLDLDWEVPPAVETQAEVMAHRVSRLRRMPPPTR